MLHINKSEELCALAAYLADYLTEELNRSGIGHGISMFDIQDALNAYIGGAADHQTVLSCAHD